jgi:hypothetical protein
MSILQSESKPLLIPLIGGKPVTLRLKQLRILARWVAMTAMTAEFLPPSGDPAISQGERTFVQQGGMPSNWRIWIGRYERKLWGAHWVHQTIPISGEEHTPNMTGEGRPWPNTQTSTFVVGQLYVTVISSAHQRLASKWHFNARSNALLRQMWPVRDRSIRWPPLEALTDDDADRIASAFFRKITSSGSLALQ